MNQMNTLEFYRKNDCWVYDDPTFKRVAEPLVLGASELLDTVMKFQLGYITRKRIIVTFSANVFPGALCGHHEGGNWYTFNNERGWLCPALFDYFTNAPEELWISVRLAKGVK